tara:strand:- start:835 stop:1890 length:1056 start_codon:yes stop_codon:yes gene_type:complete
MAFTSAETTNIANAVLEYYIDRGTVHSQSLQDKPLLQALDKASKTFPGGKENVSVAVKGEYVSSLAGYTHDTTVNYSNPAKIQRVNYPWEEHHVGLEISLTELKKDGISVVDTNGASTSNHSEREKTALVNLLEDKVEDLLEGYARSLNSLLYGDGTTANSVHGIRSFIKDDPTVVTGNVGGLLQTTANSWWRNRFAIDIAVSGTDQPLAHKLHQELRQLRRFGGKPNLAVCGSAFLDQLAKELRSSGNYTQTGFSSSGATDIAVADIHYGNLKFVYDPTLDDLTISGVEPAKRCYIIDTSKMCLYYMEGEKMKRHNPARPHNKYMIYRAITTTCAMVATQLNCHGVYEIA